MRRRHWSPARSLNTTSPTSRGRTSTRREHPRGQGLAATLLAVSDADPDRGRRLGSPLRGDDQPARLTAVECLHRSQHDAPESVGGIHYGHARREAHRSSVDTISAKTLPSNERRYPQIRRCSCGVIAVLASEITVNHGDASCRCRSAHLEPVPPVAPVTSMVGPFTRPRCHQQPYGLAGRYRSSRSARRTARRRTTVGGVTRAAVDESRLSVTHPGPRAVSIPFRSRPRRRLQ